MRPWPNNANQDQFCHLLIAELTPRQAFRWLAMLRATGYKVMWMIPEAANA